MEHKLRQQQEFTLLWQRFSNELRREGNTVSRQANSPDAPERFLTTVVRLRGEVALKISEVQKLLRNVDDSHYFYPASDLHMTILDCTMFCKNPKAISMTDIVQIGEVCKGIFEKFSCFTIEGIGLNVFPTTIYVQIITDTEVLENLRHELGSCLSERFPRNNYQPLVPKPFLAYTNIVRFNHPDVQRILDRVSTLRTSRFGKMTVEAVEMVVTDKILLAAATKTHSIIRFYTQK